MLVSILYVLTAVVTGLHNLYGLMNFVNGAPVNPLNWIAFLGSMVLLVAAVLTRFRPRLAATTGLVGTVLLSVFYLPLIVVSFSMPFSAWQEIRSFISFREYVSFAGMLFGPILLTVCTVIELRTFRARSGLSSQAGL